MIKWRHALSTAKRVAYKMWSLPSQVNFLLKLGYFFGNRIPVIGYVISLIIDRIIFLLFGLEAHSRTIHVKEIRIGHPNGVLLGGNGIRSEGLIIVNAGVKFIGNTPDEPDYLRLHKEQRVFELGSKIFFGTDCVVIGPRKICSNVAIGAMSLVREDITEPGVYVGNPARFVKREIPESWFQ